MCINYSINIFGYSYIIKGLHGQKLDPKSLHCRLANGGRAIIFHATQKGQVTKNWVRVQGKSCFCSLITVLY